MSTEIKVGDKVHWTHTTGNGRSFSMRRREGVVEAIGKSGKLAQVKTTTRRTVVIAVENLNKDGEPGEIDAVVNALRQNYKREAGL